MFFKGGFKILMWEDKNFEINFLIEIVIWLIQLEKLKNVGRVAVFIYCVYQGFQYWFLG